MFGHRHITQEQLNHVFVDPDINAVVIGMDAELTYTKAAYAMLILQLNPTCLFISTNRDLTYPSTVRILPGGGSCVAMLAACAQREPINVGKPEDVMMKLAIRDHNLTPSRTLMVGDRLDTDILFAQNAQVAQLLVLTGVTKKPLLFHPNNTIIPTYYIETFADVHGVKAKL
jgi:HAD superfamily hydrolase (TIGR01450 family)